LKEQTRKVIGFFVWFSLNNFLRSAHRVTCKCEVTRKSKRYRDRQIEKKEKDIKKKKVTGHIYWCYGKNGFTEISKNSSRYRSIIK